MVDAPTARAHHPCGFPAAPTFPDSDQAINAGPGLVDRVARLREGRDARIAYERQLETALKDCNH